MFKVLVDTNVLLDFLSLDRSAHEQTAAALRACMESSDARVYVCAGSLKDAYYIYGRHYGSEKDARRKIQLVRNAFELLDLTSVLVDQALASDEPDFEDGLIRAAAESVRADGIFSRDEGAFLGGSIRRMTAAEVIERVGARGRRG